MHLASQRGVVLVVSLIILGVLSLLAATSLRNVGLTESLANNVRTTELATRAAEIALRYCEENAATLVVTDTGGPFWNVKNSADLSYWDSSTSKNKKYYNIIPTADLNQSGMSTTFRRSPECMVEKQVIAQQDETGAIVSADSYIITARGFGPEVEAADSSRSRPKGTEVWLQSFID